MNNWPVQMMVIILCLLSFTACGGGGGGDTTTATTTQLDPDPVDTSAPGISSRTPGPNATRVNLDSNIVVTFSESMAAISVNSVTFRVIDPVWQVPLSGYVSYNASTNTATFDPNGSFTEYSQYTVILDGITDAALNALPYTEWQFTTADKTAPQTTAAPLGGYYNTPQNITLTCTDVNGSGCAATYYTMDGSTPTTGSPEYSGPISLNTLNTPILLQYFSVDNEDNNESVQTQNYIIDTIPPEVTSTTPDANATDVTLTKVVTATFSEPVIPATISPTNFTLVAADHQVTGTVSLDATESVVSFVPAYRLECDTVYTATINSGVSDRAGNLMQMEYSWNFTSHVDCSEPVTTVTPDGGVFNTGSQNVSLTCTDTGTVTSGCKQMVYTTDGSMPSFAPLNGTLVSGSSTTVNLTTGDTYLRFASMDNAGNHETVKEALFSLSTNGYTYVATEVGLSRGVGPIPDSYVNTLSMQASNVNREAQFVDATNGRIYLIAGRGLFMSDNDGTTWARRDAPGSSNTIESIYARGSRVYLAGIRGLFISDDGAASFQATGFTGAVEVVHEIGRTVIVGTTSAIYRSTDRGYSFTQVYDSVHVTAIATYGGNLYVATNANGLLVSSDKGLTFVNRTVSDGLGTDHLTDLFVTTDGTLYVTTNTWNDGSPGTGGLSVSTDNGESFTTYTNGLPTNDLRCVAVSGNDVYVSGYFSYQLPTNPSIAISNDGGMNFTATASMEQGLAGSSIADMDFVGGQLFAFTEGGLSISNDGGSSFTTIGLGDNDIHDVAVDASGKIYVTSGFTAYYREGGGISVSTDGGHSFTTLNLANGLPSFVANKIDVSADGNTIHVTTDFIDNAYTAGYAKSIDGGVSFSQPAVTPYDWIFKARGRLAVDGNNVYIAAGSEGYAFLVSNDSGATFTQYESIGAIGDSHPADVKVAADGAVYVSTYSGLARSNDNGASFGTVLTRAANGLGSNRIGLLHIDGSTIYAQSIGDSMDPGSIDGLSVSTDGGNSFSTWTIADGLPSNNISSIGTYSGMLYIGTSSGLAISDDGGASFTVRTDADGLGYSIPRAVVYKP